MIKGILRIKGFPAEPAHPHVNLDSFAAARAATDGHGNQSACFQSNRIRGQCKDEEHAKRSKKQTEEKPEDDVAPPAARDGRADKGANEPEKQ